MKDTQIPIIDISLLDRNSEQIAENIKAVCREHGFFYISNHGISEELQAQLMKLSQVFFDLSLSEKMKIDMSKGGKAWRGYFPVNGELTSGQPDLKEGIYFGQELSAENPLVKAGTPMHGANLFLEQPLHFKETVLEYIHQVTQLGHKILQGIALSLGLKQDYFYQNYTQDPLILFRIFHYPAQDSTQSQWGVGEHTDYGLLTILLQDQIGGLQVKSRGQWIDAPPITNTFICNIGDMLDRMTGGLYRSTPHRVFNQSGESRYSFPLFFDPGFNTEVHRIENIESLSEDDRNERWDHSSVHEISGTYGEYILGKVGKVFPELLKDVLE